MVKYWEYYYITIERDKIQLILRGILVGINGCYIPEVMKVAV